MLETVVEVAMHWGIHILRAGFIWNMLSRLEMDRMMVSLQSEFGTSIQFSINL
jgi:hypothetical protein